MQVGPALHRLVLPGQEDGDPENDRELHVSDITTPLHRVLSNIISAACLPSEAVRYFERLGCSQRVTHAECPRRPAQSALQMWMTDEVQAERVWRMRLARFLID